MWYFVSILGIVIVATASRTSLHPRRLRAIDITEAPYQVALLKNESEFLCSGAILGKQIIITAAHCVNNLKPEDLSIRAGSKYWNKGGELINVDRSEIHGDFHNTTGRAAGDFSVLHLVKSLDNSSMVKEIVIASQSPKNSEMASVCGWFRINGSIPDGLHCYITAIEHVSPNVFETRNLLLNTSISANYSGTLVINNQLAGVLSIDDAEHLQYVKLARYNSWILKTIAKLTAIRN